LPEVIERRASRHSHRIEDLGNDEREPYGIPVRDVYPVFLGDEKVLGNGNVGHDIY
jgi:hypothetical protein